jgi:hypothetical protein
MMKLVFAPISLYDLKLSFTPRPYALLELSIILCGCSFIIGWYLTGKRVDALYKQNYTSDTTCYNAKVKTKHDWMLVVNNKITFFFKTLYWFSIAYLHSLFIFAFCLILIYSLIICIKGFPAEVYPKFISCLDYTKSKLYTGEEIEHYVWTKGSKVSKIVQENTYTIPGIFSMKGIFVFFQREFLLLHATVFITGLVFLYINCIIFLKIETDESSEELIATNRERFKFLLYISYVFIDSCYMFFELVMMLFFDCPSELGDEISKEKNVSLKKDLEEIFTLSALPKAAEATEAIRGKMLKFKEERGSTFKHFSKILKTSDIFTYTDRTKILKLISSIPNRDEFCKTLEI